MICVSRLGFTAYSMMLAVYLTLFRAAMGKTRLHEMYKCMMYTDADHYRSSILGRVKLPINTPAHISMPIEIDI